MGNRTLLNEVVNGFPFWGLPACVALALLFKLFISSHEFSHFYLPILSPIPLAVEGLN